MKIHIHTPSFFPKLVGMTYAAHSHAQLLTELGADVTVIAPGAGDPGVTSGHQIECAVEHFDISGSGMPWSRLQGDIAKLLAHAEREQPDIIISEGWYTPGTQLLPILKRFCRHAVLSSHGAADLSMRDFSAKQMARSLAYRYANRFSLEPIYSSLSAAITLANYQDADRFSDVTKFHRRGIPVFVCPNFSIYAPNPIPRRLSSTKRLLHVGEMSRNKNQELAISLISKLPVEYGLTFVFPSETPYFEHVKGLARKYKVLDRIEFISGKNRPQIEAIYDNSDLILILSFTEAQPLVAVDALIKGIPYVSTSVGCMREFKGGLVVDPHDFESAIRGIFSTPETYAECSASAYRHYVDHHDRSNSLKSMKNLIDTLMK